jgi:uncharacterized protein (DUF2141 family)
MGAAPTSTFAQNSEHQQNVLRVQIDGFRNDEGKAHCILFNDSETAAFPEQDKKAFKRAEALSIKETKTEVDFKGIPPGRYALVCYHDESNNGKFDRNLIGMPKEGYSFSNNVKPKLSAPNFDQCAFDYRGGDQSISTTMIN